MRHRHSKRTHLHALKFFLILLFIIIIIFIVGILLYRFSIRLSWGDSFYRAAVINSSSSVEKHIRTNKQKVFIGLYSFFVSIFGLAIIGSLISYIFLLYARQLKVPDS